MSLFSTVANYGGRQPSNSQNIKQFVVSPTVSQADCVFSKTTSTSEIFITPANRKRSVYIYTDLYVNGAIFNTSDKNHKEEIVPISDSKIDQLFNLEPVEYKFKTDVKKRIHYGLIAQDVEKVYPELVSNVDLGFKTVNYIELVPVLLSKMKIMQKEIDELREQIKVKKEVI